MVIDPEIKNLIRPLNEEEYEKLKESILSEGIRDPLVVWNGIKVFNDVGWFIRTPGYKRDWEFQDGFVAQKGLGPNPVGCAKLELQFGAHTYPQVNAHLEIVP